MDQKLLNALNNIGLALEELVDALNTKSEASTATGSAIQSGNFAEDLKSINEGIKSIKADTQTIIKNQQTILSQAKSSEKDSKLGIMDSLGSDDSMMSNITKGIGVIMLLAVAVLAIGMAFKLVGEVNILSVIGLALGITIISIAFEKVAKLKLSKEEALIASGVIVILSIAVAISSYFFSKVGKVENSQFLASILISGIFVILSYSLKNILGAFKGVNIITLIAAAIFLPIILVSISKAVADSSENFSKVKMMGLGSFFGSIMVSAIFVVLSYSLRNMIKAFDGINPLVAISAAYFLPNILVAISGAIAESSEILSKVKMMGLDSFFGAIMVSAIFLVLSYGIKRMISAFKGIDPATALLAAATIPILMVAISGAIWLSSIILDKMTIVSDDKLKNAALIGGGLSLITLAMIPVIKLASKLKPNDLLIATLAIPVIATAIMLSSWILSAGKYDGDFPTTEWIKGVSLSILVFGAATLGLGALITASGGLGLGAIALGAVGVLIVGAAIAATSHALKLGDYTTSYPGLDWAKGVSLSLVAFGTGMTVLGGIIFASFGIGAAMLKAGSNAVLMVAETIVETSFRLQKGDYKGGPSKEWAEGISLALGAFSPVYGMLMANKLLSFLGGGVGPDDFTEAIKTVSKGIISAANFFASPENPGVWKGAPTKEWAESVGLAIGAFAPVYEILAKNSGWFSSGVSPEDFAGKFDDSGKLIKDGAIQVISRGIISAAKFFADNTSPFEEGSYPSKKWAEGVGSALGAFSPIFDIITEKSGFWRSGDSVIKTLLNGITSSAKTIVDVAKILHSGSDFFSTNIDPNYIKNLSKNMLDFNELVKELTDSESKGMMSRLADNLLGTDPITQIARRMVTLADGYDKLADSLIKLGGAMKVLNISDIRMLGGLTPTLATPTDSGRGGGLMDSAKSLFGFKKAETGPTVGAGAQGAGGEESSLKEDMAKIIKLLTNIDKSTEESSVSLSDMLVQLRDEGVKTVSARN